MRRLPADLREGGALRFGGKEEAMVAASGGGGTAALR